MVSNIYSRELRRGEGCPPRADVEDTTRIPLRTQAGVFLLSGVCIGVAVLTSLVEAHLARGGKLECWRLLRRGALRGDVAVAPATANAEGEGMGMGLLTDSEMLRKLVADVQELRNDVRSRNDKMKEGMAQGGIPDAEPLDAEPLEA